MDKTLFVLLTFVSALAICSAQLGEMGMANLAMLSAANQGGMGTGSGMGGGAMDFGMGAGPNAGTGTGTTMNQLSPLEMQMAAEMMGIEGNAGMTGMMGGMAGGPMTGAGAGTGVGGIRARMMNRIRGVTTLMQTMGPNLGSLGPGGVSTMVRALITPIITEEIVNSKLNEVVKIVVGPHANPSPEMFDYARAQGNPPSTPKEMIKYVNFMVEIAKREGIFMPDGRIQKPVMSSSTSKRGTIGRLTGRKQGPSLTEVKSLILKRSMLYQMSVQKAEAKLAQEAGPGMGLGLGMMNMGMGMGMI